MKDRILFWALGAIVLFCPAPASGQEEKKVYRKVSSERLEAVLKNMEIVYKKTADKTPDTYFYDFERNQQKIRLGNHGGLDLWIDCAFNKATLETINQWNTRAKFSRAVLAKVDDNETAIVESQLDCVGGVTEDMIRQFIRRFDDEVKAFDKFVSK